MTVVSGVLLVLGAAFVLVSAVGMVRFHDTFERMHAASKASSIGIIALGLGGAVVADARSALALLLVVALHVITVPVGSHLVSRATHAARARGDHGQDGGPSAEGTDAGT